jgi:hypothetical protein
MNNKYFHSILTAVIFIIIAASSKVVEMTALSSPRKEIIVKSKPIINRDPSKLVFCVLENEFIDEKLRSDIEILLSSNGIQVADITNAKQIYLEQTLNKSTSKTTIDYYVYVETFRLPSDPQSSTPVYFYQLIDGRDSRVDYAAKINAINYENLIAPFAGPARKIDLSFIQLFKTQNNTQYNQLIDLNNDSDILKSSEVIVNEGKTKTFPQNTKPKIQEEFYYNQYAVCLNLATQYLLKKDFTRCKEASQLAANYASKVSDITYITNPEYNAKINQAVSKWEKAIQDSIQFEKASINGKKSININNDWTEKGNRNSKDDMRFKMKFAYSNAVVSLFNASHSNLDIYQRSLIDNILSTNTQVTQKAIGQTSGADYLLSILINNWDIPRPVVETHKDPQYDLKGNIKAYNTWYTYKYDVKCRIVVKITNNKDAIIMGSIPLEFINNQEYQEQRVFSSVDIFNSLFDDGRLRDFYSKTIK